MNKEEYQRIKSESTKSMDSRLGVDRGKYIKDDSEFDDSEIIAFIVASILVIVFSMLFRGII